MANAVGNDIDVAPLEMSQAEYARHRGVRRQRVHKWINGGKIPVLPNGRIDVVAADRALGETRERIVVREDLEPDVPRAGPGFHGLTKAKTATEVYRARLAQLEYEERIGRLVPIEDVHRATIETAEVLLRVLEMPLMRADALMAAASKGLAEFRAALRELVNEQRARAAAEWQELPAAVAMKEPITDGAG
jgi:hypothetical protein